MRDWVDLPANVKTVAVVESCIDYLHKTNPYPPNMAIDRMAFAAAREAWAAAIFGLEQFMAELTEEIADQEAADANVWWCDHDKREVTLADCVRCTRACRHNPRGSFLMHDALGISWDRAAEIIKRTVETFQWCNEDMRDLCKVVAENCDAEAVLVGVVIEQVCSANDKFNAADEETAKGRRSR